MVFFRISAVIQFWKKKNGYNKPTYKAIILQFVISILITTVELNSIDFIIIQFQLRAPFETSERTKKYIFQTWQSEQSFLMYFLLLDPFEMHKMRRFKCRMKKQQQIHFITL